MYSCFFQGSRCCHAFGGTSWCVQSIKAVTGKSRLIYSCEFQFSQIDFSEVVKTEQFFHTFNSEKMPLMKTL